MIETIIGFFIGASILFALGIAIYGQYLLLKDRDEYRKRFNIDPWRHGWERFSFDDQREKEETKQNQS